MHSEGSLAVLYGRLRSRVYRLKQLARGVNAMNDPETGRCCSYIVIEAMNCWVLFSRSLIVSSALGATTRSTGRVASLYGRRSTVDYVIVQAALAENPRLGVSGLPARIDRRLEPVWHEPAVIIRLATALQLSNGSTITQALSVGATFMRDLPPVRNYFAHKNQDTAERVRRIGRQYGVSAYAGGSGRMKKPGDVIMSSAPGRPQSLLADWLDELDTTADLMVD